MTARELLLKAAHLVRTSLACKGITGAALLECAIAEAAMDQPASVARAAAKGRAFAAVRMVLFNDPGPCAVDALARELDQWGDNTAAIADVLDEAASERIEAALVGFDPSSARKVKHWSETDDD